MSISGVVNKDAATGKALTSEVNALVPSNNLSDVSNAATALANLGGIGGNAVQVLSTTTGIDAKTVADTILYTVPGGKTLVVTDAKVRPTSVVGFVTAGSAGIGSAVSGDIVAGGVMTGVTNTSTGFDLYPTLKFALVTAGNTVKFNLTTGAVATTFIVSVDLLGYLI